MHLQLMGEAKLSLFSFPLPFHKIVFYLLFIFENRDRDNPGLPEIHDFILA